MSLLTLPVELIDTYILPCLSWNDLLRMRRVSLRLEDITTSYMRSHPELAPEIEISDTNSKRTVHKFLELGVCSKKIYINNIELGGRFFEENETLLNQFVELHGPTITELRVAQLSIFLLRHERNFAARLVNLEHLKVGYINFELENEDDKIIIQDLISEENPLGLPPNFERLKSIIIGQQKSVQVNNMILYMISLLRYCSGLESVRLPYDNNITDLLRNKIGWLEEPSAINGIMNTYFVYQDDALKRENSNIKCIDFYNFHVPEIPNRTEVEYMASIKFVLLCLTSIEKNVVLKNVSSRWFIYWYTMQEGLHMPFFNSIGRAVRSMINITPGCLGIDMPNLEKINILATSQCNVDDAEVYQIRPNWPALSCLKINVDSKVHRPKLALLPFANRSGLAICRNMKLDTNDLFNFLFKDIYRPQLKKLSLKFKEDTEHVSIPNLEDIIKSCPELRKLKITNWPGTNEELEILWTGLTKLEEICIKSTQISRVGDDAFIGSDVNSPAFLNLKGLKKLSLIGLEKMPNVTDSLFSSVIANLNLSQLYIKTDTPLVSVTLAGIKRLSHVDSPFAKGIERFQFNTWSLSNVSTEKFLELEKSFRSHGMV